jgi:hypothetical protein
MTITLERGFKAWCERTSGSIRKELEVGLASALPLERFADLLGITLWTPEDVPGLQKEDSVELLEASSSDWYAVGLQCGGQSTIIYNPRQSKRRQASDISHEIAHFLLEHEPARLILSESEALADVWLRSYDARQEDEANCLGWTLLVPRDGLASLVRRRLSVPAIADIFGVSEQLINFRVNSTGVRRQYSRWRK